MGFERPRAMALDLSSPVSPSTCLGVALDALIATNISDRATRFDKYKVERAYILTSKRTGAAGDFATHILSIHLSLNKAARAVARWN